MTLSTTLILLLGACAAAVGQILFKLGATDRSQLLEFINPHIVVGLICYGVSTVLWIFALSKAPLVAVYPFTVLTFIVVYCASVFVLGETVNMMGLVGVTLVLGGLFLTVMATGGKG